MLLYGERYTPESSVNRQMVKDGYAYVSVNRKERKNLILSGLYDAEIEAKKNRSGVYRLPESARVPPAVFRKQQQGQQDDTRQDDFINLLTSLRTLLGIIALLILGVFTLLYLDAIRQLIDDVF